MATVEDIRGDVVVSTLDNNLIYKLKTSPQRPYQLSKSCIRIKSELNVNMKLLAFVLLLFLVICNARHIHPGNTWNKDIIFHELDGSNVDILNLKPNRFIPLNSQSFFNTYGPCKEGFVRDAIGICREIWDK